MSDVRKDTTDSDAEAAIVETEESREAAAEGESPQDFKSERDAAPSRTSFDDDAVTPRLNDGR